MTRPQVAEPAASADRAAPATSVKVAGRRVRRGKPGGGLYGMGPAITLSLAPAVLIFLIFFAIPLIVLIATAFTQWTGRDISFVGLDNFSRIGSDGVFWKAVVNTLFYGAIGVFVQIPIGVCVGIFLAARPRGWKLLRAAFFIPYMISGAAIAMVFTVVYNPRYGLLNVVTKALGGSGSADWLFSSSTARWAVAATFAFTVGFAAVLVSAEMASFPAEVFEAGGLDGATGWQRHRYLTLPMLRNVIGTLVLLSVLANLAAFDIVYILTAGGPADSTATIMVYGYRAYTAGHWGMANAVGVVVVAMGLVLIVAVRRVFRIGEAE